MAQVLLNSFHVVAVLQRERRKGMPLRYNRVKSEKPRKIKGFRSFGQVFSSFSTPKKRVPATRVRKEMFH